MGRAFWLPDKKSKFRNKITEVDGIKFKSKKEADYYCKIKALKNEGEILFFLMQVPMHIIGGTKYVCDFVEFWADGCIRFVDVKGIQTATYKLKKKQVEVVYPINIEEE